VNAAPRLLCLYRGCVQAEWIDYNGHMNLAYYVLAFDYATDAFLDYLGLTEDFRARQQASTFAAEIHVNYLRELHRGDSFRISTQLLGYDHKRIHYFHRLYHADEGWLAATNELMSLYMDMGQRRVTSMPGEITDALDSLMASHRGLAWPEQAGRSICMGPRST